ncbi:hypothetical protein QBC33DRAFT_119669 [Phialemonium atrogriseum]|uniref:Macro domain-containing protein n=1 Tax=Phialemonium atrogriseum TaxID=1093897 RepID=A0AAJ0BZE3_9PEZI|nr:uncharacterized protein QBC33DRAFT_119669 [Phialemonium atrogriseum]KAK1765877.1 hypothetical protein QBC33DRAFT_119669 [Phialemonium atrogriseum]
MPFHHLAKMAVTESSDIPILSLLYKLSKLAPPSLATKLPKTLNGPSTPPTPSRVLNDRIGLIRGDITTLAVDAIVNAANRSLLGGGGVDGAIHRAAGHGLLEECYTLNGCHTGSAKITRGYKLPCKKVVHAVGPVYDVLEPEKSERLLAGCYTKSLELAVANNCQTIAFSSISTGVYGYPSREAAPIAISTVRKFLEQDSGRRIQKVVFVTFEAKDVDAYNEFLPQYFPPVSEDGGPSEDAAIPKKSMFDEFEKGKGTETKAEAEPKAATIELPSAPTANPSSTQHADKKQKHGNA